MLYNIPASLLYSRREPTICQCHGIGYRGAWANGGNVDNDSIGRHGRYFTASHGSKINELYISAIAINMSILSPAFAVSVRSILNFHY